MNIYEKMGKITSELETVNKDLTIGSGNYAYKAVSEAGILAAIQPLEEKYNIYSYPVSRRIIDSDVLTGDGKSKMYLRVETTYRFVNTEQPDEFIDVVSYGDGIDSADKAPGKAMTYSDKYALMKAYKIITGDDPDQEFSEPDTFQQRQHRAPEKPKTPEQPLIMCEMCGNPVPTIRRENGEAITPEEFAKNTKELTGHVLCKKCFVAYRKTNAG